MNGLMADLKRAIISWKFLIGLLVEIVILYISGFDSALFRVCVPVLASLPYSTAWMDDYKSGFIKAYIPRTGKRVYILGKISACGLSGGILELLGCLICVVLMMGEDININFLLVFLSGVLWAVVAAALSALSDSRYVAYGGGFVIYYLLVILNERYFEKLYWLCPYEWLFPGHGWIFGEYGVACFVTGITLIMVCFYCFILRRGIENV